MIDTNFPKIPPLPELDPEQKEKRLSRLRHLAVLMAEPAQMAMQGSPSATVSLAFDSVTFLMLYTAVLEAIAEKPGAGK